MNRYLSAFAWLLAGSFLESASWQIGLGIIVFGSWSLIGPAFLIGLLISLLGLFYIIHGLAFFVKECCRWLKGLFRKLGR